METRILFETYFPHCPTGTLMPANDSPFAFVPMFLEYGPRHREVVV